MQERIEQVLRDMMGEQTRQNPRTSPAALPSVVRGAQRRRKTGGVDSTTMALAVGSMAMYWVMPAMLAGARKRRRARRRAEADANAVKPDAPTDSQG